jgi:hypothetical protein
VTAIAYQAEILAVGMMTPVGLDVASAAAAVRAGVSGVRESSVYDKWFEPHRIALVPEDALPPIAPALGSAPMTSAHARMLRLAAPALQQAAELVSKAPAALFLGLPEARPGEPDAVGSTFLEDLRGKHPKALAEPRQIARLLCGLSSPAISAAKLGRNELFGALEERRFADVLEWCSNPGSWP